MCAGLRGPLTCVYRQAVWIWAVAALLMTAVLHKVSPDTLLFIHCHALPVCLLFVDGHDVDDDDDDADDDDIEDKPFQWLL